MSLTKVLYLFAASLSVCAVICMLLATRRWRLGLLLGLIFTGTLLLAWVGCGQEIANLSSFVLNSFRFSREYDQAA